MGIFDNLSVAAPIRPKNLGTTFSQLQCSYLKLDYKETLENLLTINFDVYRIAAYWDEIEPNEGELNFYKLDWIIKTVADRNIKIILSVGLKSPRWPEFHIPQWLKQKHPNLAQSQQLDSNEEIAQKAVQFTTTVVQRYKNIPQIKYWLIENEGMSKIFFTNKQHLSFSFIRDEVGAVRSLKRPDQKIMCTSAIDIWPLWEADDAKSVRSCTELADAVGINIYNKVPISKNWYVRPTYFYWRKLDKWKREIENAMRESWISESQAEPWEWGNMIHTEKSLYPSSSPEQAVQLATRLAKKGFENILMWGCEYWYWCKKNEKTDSWWTACTEFASRIS